VYTLFLVKDATVLEVIEEEPPTSHKKKKNQRKKRNCCDSLKVIFSTYCKSIYSVVL